MKIVFLSLGLSFFSHLLLAQQAEIVKGTPDPTQKIEKAEVACGQCQFGLKGKGCDLAIRIRDTAYFVDRMHIDSLGDAHAADGFCNSIRKAKVQGYLINNRFQLTYIKLLPTPFNKPE